jgi:DNA-binding CsgD family transcriptional regulator
MLLSSLASTLMRVDDIAEAAEVARRAVATAQAAGALREEADALITAGGASLYLGPDDAGLSDLRAGLDLALRGNFPASALRGYINLSDALQLLGRHAEAMEVAAQGRALAARVGRARTLGSFLAGNMAMSALQQGHWPETERLTAESLRTAREGIYRVILLQPAVGLAARRGDYPAAAVLLRQARKETGASVDAQALLPIAFDEALVRHGQGDLAGARELLVATLAGREGPISARHAWPLLWLGTRTAADEAILARDRRVPPSAESVAAVAELTSIAERLPARFPEARGYRLLFDAERERGDSSDSPQPWAAALAIWRDLRAPYLIGYCLLRYAEALLAAGDRAAAGQAVKEAHATAAELGAAPIVEQAAALARRARLPLDEGAPPGPAGDKAARPEVAGPAGELARLGLTHREREVLFQIAAGRSNAQIAKVLFISPKTAGVHVSNILAKLDVASRVQAAAVAHRLGLTGTPDR